jgi:putative spermidine/putrescine transport system ATP-binding protein
MRAEIKRLHSDLGLTSIYVTHDQAEALSLSDRIVVMRDGRIVQTGTPAEIHDRPQDLFVAPAVAAVRPEDVRQTTDAEGVNVLWGHVRLTEYLGREHDVEVVAANHVIKARLARLVPIGSAIGLRFPPERVVVLPAQDGQRTKA